MLPLDNICSPYFIILVWLHYYFCSVQKANEENVVGIECKKNSN